ncbi:hypothetical protein V9L05_03600 [Bernardetia sp. Wsw4-3y2]|uniref:hypothetical protein n=1 Tax=Bernardetia sp. Wsw4-3y2 TaxID=3127471 RepID=UPI0030D31572
MKLLFKFLFAIIIIGVFSCQENKAIISQKKEIQEMDSAIINVSYADAYDEFDNEMKNTIAEAKEKIKYLIKNNKNEKIVKHNYKQKSKITNSESHIEIEFGNLFIETDIHALLRIGAIYQTVICVYYPNSDSLQTLLYFDEYHNTYQGDTIRDVNGDNKKDFIIKSYPMSGCCLAELRDVYLFQTATKFSAQYHFLNPTFYPKEKIIRGLTYGWNPSLYKYKWNELKIDTLEYIIPNIEDTTRSTFFKTKKWRYPLNMENVEKINLNSIPKEYHSIDNFDVFLRGLD